ncbi:cytochrome b/b6 domain-containing protein [Porticoccus sp. W117]|uniref:cytochrome b/b6 domain-containing protein n=1 Tax=Porticoccus sp. W117 TaxID=3054777 RepID=UPI00259536AC|nr:cytochrome b/b6 domain-containing protein [Porticoccus sp. W117]MDM3872441.1 cytochrome b/b6 domain-containing protein [Porticoccus sp. W117]
MPATAKWDIVVRVIHWSVAALFLTNYFYTEPGYDAHINIGWIILSLVGLRLLWGLTFAKGPNHLKDFLPRRRTAGEHLQHIKHRQQPNTVGHNPFGAIAIYLMWLGLASAAFTGWLQDTDWGFDNGVDIWHRRIVQWLFYLVIVHVSAVVLTSLWLRVNLIRAMVLGRFKGTSKN